MCAVANLPKELWICATAVCIGASLLPTIKLVDACVLAGLLEFRDADFCEVVPVVEADAADKLGHKHL